MSGVSERESTHTHADIAHAHMHEHPHTHVHTLTHTLTGQLRHNVGEEEGLEHKRKYK